MNTKNDPVQRARDEYEKAYSEYKHAGEGSSAGNKLDQARDQLVVELLHEQLRKANEAKK